MTPEDIKSLCRIIAIKQRGILLVPTKLMKSKYDPLTPDLSTLCKLGSIIVHVEEMLSSKGHPFDQIALQAILDDPDVQTWIKAMGTYLPVKR